MYSLLPHSKCSQIFTWNGKQRRARKFHRWTYCSRQPSKPRRETLAIPRWWFRCQTQCWWDPQQRLRSYQVEACQICNQVIFFRLPPGIYLYIRFYLTYSPRWLQKLSVFCSFVGWILLLFAPAQNQPLTLIGWRWAASQPLPLKLHFLPEVYTELTLSIKKSYCRDNTSE